MMRSHIGSVSDYELTRALPDNLKTSLPGIEEWEEELLSDVGNISDSKKENP